MGKYDLSEVSVGRLRSVYPDVRVRTNRLYQDFYQMYQYRLSVSQGLRSFEKQKLIYNQGRIMPGTIVTNAKPGYSFHNYGLAVDSCFQGTDPWLESLEASDEEEAKHLWTEYGRLAKAHGFRWGGDFVSRPDRPHIELSYGLTIQECLDLYRKGGLVSIWYQCDKLIGVEPGSSFAQFTDKERTV